jgi:3-oxoacyl-[acyl-carrier protein] reductase
MTRSLSEEQQNALKVNIPLGRLGSPEDIAHAVSFLA